MLEIERIGFLDDLKKETEMIEEEKRKALENAKEKIAEVYRNSCKENR